MERLLKVRPGVEGAPFPDQDVPTVLAAARIRPLWELLDTERGIHRVEMETGVPFPEPPRWSRVSVRDCDRYWELRVRTSRGFFESIERWMEEVEWFTK